MMSGKCGQTAGADGNPMADMMSKMMSGKFGQKTEGGQSQGWKGCGKGQGWKGCGQKQEAGKGQDQEQKPWWEKCGKGQGWKGCG